MIDTQHSYRYIPHGRRHRRGIVAALLALAGTITVAHAQVDLEVTVTNGATHTPIAAVAVALDNTEIGVHEKGISNEQGKVYFHGLLTSGTYAVSVAESDQYGSSSVTNVVLRSGAVRSVNLALAPRKTVSGAGVTVTGRGQAELNAINAEVSATLPRRQIEDLPVEGRDLTRALYRLPNVTQATGFFAEAPNVSINGVNGLYASYLVDGMDNNENFLGGEKFPMPVGFVQSVTVLSNNYSAEFGRTGNGVFNVTTRSGSNTFTGEAFYLTRPGPSIDASSPDAQRDLSGNQVKDGFQRQQFGAAVGGPIARDKSFFYLDLEQTSDTKDNLLNVPELGINETVRGHNNFTLGSLKLTQFWSDRFSSSIRANIGLVNIERQGGGLDGGITFPSAGNTQDRNSLLLASQNIYTADGFTYEGNLQYSRFRWNYAHPVNPNDPQVYVLDSAGLGLAILGHPGYVFDDVESTINLQQKVTFDLGDNRLKFGVELLSANFALAGGGNPNGNYVVQLTGDQQRALAARHLGSGMQLTDIPAGVQVTDYNVELEPNSFGRRQNVISAYAEDLISVSSRLNLSVGLRYDYDDLSVGGGDKGDLNNIAPRLSFNYKLDDRSVIRGGYGLFYDKILYAIYSDALQQNTTSAGYRQQIQQLIAKGILPSNTDINKVTYDGNLGVDVFSGVTYLHGPDAATLQSQRADLTANERRILNPNGYQNPYTHQFSLGYQYQVSDNTLFYVDLVHTESGDLYRLRDLNAPSPYPLNDPNNVVVRTQAQADSTRPVALLPGGARSIVVTETAGEATYSAATVNLVKEKGEDAFAYRLSYTLSRSRNNTEDINFKASDANNFDREWGPSVNDRTHVISAVFYYYPIDGLTLTLAALVQSGQPVNRIADATKYGTTDLNGDGTSFADAYVLNIDRYPGEARNSDRLPWSKTFDLGVQYAVALPTGRAEVRADVFNLFNSVNLSGYTNNATQSNQIQEGPAGSGIVQRSSAPPRQFQFGVRYFF
ncbi:MAG: TonB-dependent receptor [Bacteroidetes bacterium]|nr:TonB-dependent receptor [Bacteroidota bacterium]